MLLRWDRRHPQCPSDRHTFAIPDRHGHTSRAHGGSHAGPDGDPDADRDASDGHQHLRSPDSHGDVHPLPDGHVHVDRDNPPIRNTVSHRYADADGNRNANWRLAVGGPFRVNRCDFRDCHSREGGNPV